MVTHVVTALHLNLRSSSDAGKKNVIAVLAQGTPVTRIGRGTMAGWIEIETTLSGVIVRGFVNSRFLGPIATEFPSARSTGGKLPMADLGPKAGEKRSTTGTRAYQLQESGKPGLPSSHPRGKAAGIVRIIDWLNVGDEDHLRWVGGGGKTFCNVYAYDACIISGCYLPRVWWTSRAITDLQSGVSVEAKYGATVNEMRANQIFNWFIDFGEDFGWKRLFDVDSLQSEVNSGRLGIICAQRKDMEKPGHIQVIVPENGTNAAKRNAAGKVIQPLQSNAGATNFTYGILGSTWWQGASFKQFGFWTCEPK